MYKEHTTMDGNWQKLTSERETNVIFRRKHLAWKPSYSDCERLPFTVTLVQLQSLWCYNNLLWEFIVALIRRWKVEVGIEILAFKLDYKLL